jgi:hypothetical protein
MAVTTRRGAKKRKTEKEKEEEEVQKTMAVVELEPILKAACSHFRDLGRMACVNREMAALVGCSNSLWREVAQRMKTTGALLTQADANVMLLLTPKDLKDVSRKTILTGYRRNSVALYKYLFDPVEVVELALAKHSGAVGLKRAREKREARKSKLAAGKRKREEELKTAKSKRRAELAHSMALIDGTLKIRNDSRLCQRFIDQGAGNASAIARTMYEMRWFHSTDEYKKNAAIAHGIARDEVRANFGWAPGDLYDEIVRGHLNDAKQKTVMHFVKTGRQSEVPQVIIDAYVD